MEEVVEKKLPNIVEGPRVVAFESPKMAPVTSTPDDIDDAELGARIAAPALRAKYDEAEVNETLGRMIKSGSGGAAVTPLVLQKTAEGNGMFLVHAWFGPNSKVAGHSHPAYGDCLYYVVAGEAIMGTKRLRAGATFFVPEGKSYSVNAGPAGLEFLEFRCGGPNPDEPLIRFEETSLDSVRRCIEANEAHKSEWKKPDHINDVALLQAEYDAAHS